MSAKSFWQDVPVVWKGTRKYWLAERVYFSKLADSPASWLRVDKPTTFVVPVPGEGLDALVMLLETPQSPGMQAWVALNDHLVARVGEYGGLDLVGDHPEYLQKDYQEVTVTPEKNWLWRFKSFWLRSIFFYIIFL
jgi:hypothetical protein